MKNVVLLGDSIRMYYQEKVKELLGEDYQVFYPEENCKFSTLTLNSLKTWFLDFLKADIIHFNNGQGCQYNKEKIW